MMRQISIADQSSDLHPAAGCGLHLCQRQMGNVDQRLWAFDVEFHQVDKCRPAGDVADVGALLGRLGSPGKGDRLGFVVGAHIAKSFHNRPPQLALRTVWMASRMFT